MKTHLKVLILFFITTSLFAQTRMELFEGDKHIIGKVEKDLTLSEFQVYLRSKGLDPANPKYRIIISDMEKQKQEAKLRQEKLFADIKSMKVKLDQIKDPISREAIKYLYRAVFGE